jgi:hypothetical protein
MAGSAISAVLALLHLLAPSCSRAAGPDALLRAGARRGFWVRGKPAGGEIDRGLPFVDQGDRMVSGKISFMERALWRNWLVGRVRGDHVRNRLNEQLLRIPIQRARWWLVERPGFPDEPVSVAYEDSRGLWWEYEPETGRLHNSPWLFTDYHYRAGGPDYVFTRLSPDDAKAWIARGHRTKRLRGAAPRPEARRQRFRSARGARARAY